MPFSQTTRQFTLLDLLRAASHIDGGAIGLNAESARDVMAEVERLVDLEGLVLGLLGADAHRSDPALAALREFYAGR